MTANKVEVYVTRYELLDGEVLSDVLMVLTKWLGETVSLGPVTIVSANCASRPLR